MTIVNRFLKFVEIKTKLASLFPLLGAIVYSYYVNEYINIKSTLIFFVGMLLFDMTVTAINNYMDTREAKVEGHFKRHIMICAIFVMGISAAMLGLYLTYLHGLFVLFMGIVCFCAGIGYTFGPAPISKSPYGEVVSGFIMGFCIPLIAVFINFSPTALIQYEYINSFLNLSINVMAFIKLFIFTAPFVCCIANIMLANNISDIEADRATRYTFPRHIGVKNALIVFEAVYYIAYLAITVASMFRIIPFASILVLLTFLTVRKNIKIFRMRQSKAETFPLCILNFVLICVSYITCIGFGAVLENLL